MAKISYIQTDGRIIDRSTGTIPTDESIGCMIFDVSGFENPFQDYPVLYANFHDGNVVCINNLDEASLLGIVDNNFMNGLLYYHISQFYEYIGTNKELYIAIADCSEDWSIIEQCQLYTNGKLFQIGVWTAQSIFQLNTDGELGFTPLITNLQQQANEINGRIGAPTSSTIPLSIMLCGNTNLADGKSVDYKTLPDAISLNCPKVSLFIIQNGNEQVHQMQSLNPNNAPVGALGLIMACLSVCGAEESIASVQRCDLNKNEGFIYPELGLGANNTPLDHITSVWANAISERGYIIPISYEALEASCFFSSDQTLSNGDYCTIANNRVIHKCRRTIASVWMPNINANFPFDPITHSINDAAISMLSNSIYSAIDAILVNKRGLPQIDGRRITFRENENMLSDDTISLQFDIKPANYSGIISEEISHSED